MAAKKKAAKKSAAKKSSAKRSVKKVAKRSTAKRSAKKSVKKKSKSTARYSIPSVPVSGSGRSSVSTISTTPKPNSGSYSSKSTNGSSRNTMNVGCPITKEKIICREIYRILKTNITKSIFQGI